MENKVIFPDRYLMYLKSFLPEKEEKLEIEAAERVNFLLKVQKNVKNEKQGYGIIFASGIIGFIAMCAIGSIPGNTNGDFINASPIGFLIGAVIGFVLRSCSGSDSYARARELEEEIEEVKAKKVEDIQNLRQSCIEQYNMYKEQFDKEVSSRVSQYADDAMVKEICDWSFADFVDKILKADRRSHIPEIREVLSFTVYRDHIRLSNGKLFDFEKNNYLNLENCIMQDILAHIVGRTVQFRIMERFPEDESETITEIGEERYSYSIAYDRESYKNDEKDAVIVDITYLAPNGNYIEPKHFGE